MSAELITGIICIGVGAIFLATVGFGAPYIPSRRRAIEEALDLLGLKPGQTLLELGSGDGRVLLASAKRGIRSIGYEINPLLAWYSRLLTWRYRHLVEVRRRNYWGDPLPAFDGLYVFLMRPYMRRLADKLEAEAIAARRVLKVVSLSFAFPRRRPARVQGELRLYTFGFEENHG